MKLNSKLHYAIKTLVCIAIYANENGITQKEIALKMNFSYKFLDHVMTALKVAGIVHKLPGRLKGYVLTKDPHNITIYQVYKAFEPELGVFPCVTGNIDCTHSTECATHSFFCDLNQNIILKLESTTIGQLKESQLDCTTKEPL